MALSVQTAPSLAPIRLHVNNLGHGGQAARQAEIPGGHYPPLGCAPHLPPGPEAEPRRINSGIHSSSQSCSFKLWVVKNLHSPKLSRRGVLCGRNLVRGSPGWPIRRKHSTKSPIFSCNEDNYQIRRARAMMILVVTIQSQHFYPTGTFLGRSNLVACR